MSLGEAFVEVRADLRPFGRDLKAGVKPMVEAFERELNNAVGRAVLANSQDNGRRIGDTISRGIKNSITSQFKDKNVFIAIASTLGSALDDGISALPTEVKAAIVGGIVLAIPVLSAFLTGALTAGVGAAVAGIGILLGSQFEEVQTAAEDTGQNLRAIFVSSAQAFGPAIIESLALIESRMRALQPLFGDIFDMSAGFLEPLTQGFTEGIKELAESLKASLSDIKPFVDELGAAITIVFDAIGKSIELLARSGEEGTSALRDLAAVISILILATASALVMFTKFYGIVRDVVLFLERYLGGLSIPLTLLAKLFQAIDERSNSLRSFVNTNTELDDSFVGLLSSTEAENQALKKYSDAIEEASNAVKSQLSLNISWEESLDSITASIKENGKTLDIRNEQGRANAREFLSALEIAEQRTIELLQRGEISSEQAVAQYDQQTQALRQMGIQAGLSEAEFNALFNEIIETGRIRISAEEMGINSLSGQLGAAGSNAQRLLDLLQLIKHLSKTVGAGAVAGVRGFAEGGMHFFPETVRVAEDGPEVTIPLTKPARAAQLMRESGLDSMLGSSGATQVMVFIGNEQLDSRMVRIVESNNKSQSLDLSQGTRRF